MTAWMNRSTRLGVFASFAAFGCATTRVQPSENSPTPSALSAPATSPAEVPARSEIVQAASQEPIVDKESQPQTSVQNRVRPAYAQMETLPIDLPTVLRLVDADSPAVGFAQAKVREAAARVAAAEVQWLPNLTVGITYNRFDGQTQNQRGEVFGTSRANLSAGVGPALSLDFAEAVYRPLIERRSHAAERHASQAAELNAQSESVAAYLDLVEMHAALEINADALRKTEAMLLAVGNSKEAKTDRTAGDVNRAQTEVLFRRTERLDLEAKAAVAGARLGKLLLLPPTVQLVPADVVVAPIALIDPGTTLDQLIATAIQNRPELAANREIIAAAWARVRRSERGPLFPKLTLANQGGIYGGGFNDDLQNFNSRNALSVQLYWEVKNFGYGNRAEAAERRAVLDQARFRMAEAQAKTAADIVEAAQLAAAKYETLDLAERAIAETTKLYRINVEASARPLDAKNPLDALRPLQSIQLLHQARRSYLAAVLDFNRVQYRLFTLLGNPSVAAAPADIVK